jgi:hypothetical protein|tara:strand:- start:2746 stop:3252 length:507 start_codon:yes stop_codon:yes gene_type:complete
MTNELVRVSDNYFTNRQHRFILDYCENCSYTYGEVDNSDTPPTGLIHNIPETEEIYPMIEKRISESMGVDVKKYNLYRMYINCFAPREIAYFHTDGDEGDLTFLYYPNMEWKLDDGGETQIYETDMFTGVPPIPNRMVMFDASLLHRATSFRDRHRFTIAIKYNLIDK